MFTKLLTSMLLWNNVCCQIHNIYLCICFLFWNIVMHLFTINGPCQRWHWRHYDQRRRSQDGRRWRTSRLRTRTGAGTRNPPECRIYRNRLVSKNRICSETTFLQEHVLVSRLHLDVAIGPLFANGATSLQQSMKFFFSNILIRSVCGASQEFDFLTWDWK